MKPTRTPPAAYIEHSFWPRVGLAAEKTVQVRSARLEPGGWPALQAMFPEGVRKPVWTIGTGTAARPTASKARMSRTYAEHNHRKPRSRSDARTRPLYSGREHANGGNPTEARTPRAQEAAYPRDDRRGRDEALRRAGLGDD